MSLWNPPYVKEIMSRHSSQLVSNALIDAAQRNLFPSARMAAPCPCEASAMWTKPNRTIVTNWALCRLDLFPQDQSIAQILGWPSSAHWLAQSANFHVLKKKTGCGSRKWTEWVISDLLHHLKSKEVCCKKDRGKSGGGSHASALVHTNIHGERGEGKGGAGPVCLTRAVSERKRTESSSGVSGADRNRGRAVGNRNNKDGLTRLWWGNGQPSPEPGSTQDSSSPEMAPRSWGCQDTSCSLTPGRL